jgi:hypothetical protein
LQEQRRVTIKPGFETFSVKKGPMQKGCDERVCFDGFSANRVANRADCGSNLVYEDMVTTNFDQNQRLRQLCRRQGLTGENRKRPKNLPLMRFSGKMRGRIAGLAPHF